MYYFRGALPASYGNIEVLNALIAARADLNAQGPDGYNAIAYAAMIGNIEILAALIAAKANVNNQLGRTPLVEAAFFGHTEIVNILIAARADVNAQDRFGRTPLAVAAERGHTEIVNILINAKADVNARNNIGLIAIVGAVSRGNIKIVDALIAAGADLKTHGGSLLRIATIYAYWHIAELILNAMHRQERDLSARTTLLIAKTNVPSQTPALAPLRVIGDNKMSNQYILKQLFHTICPELPTYQWLQEQLGIYYAAYRQWKRMQPGHESFDENYNGAGPA